MFQKMRADLASMWSPSSRAGNPRRLSARVGLPPIDEKSSTSDYERSLAIDEDNTSMKVSNIFFYIFIISLEINWKSGLETFFFVIALLMFFDGDGMNTTDSEGLDAYFCRNLSCWEIWALRLIVSIIDNCLLYGYEVSKK